MANSGKSRLAAMRTEQLAGSVTVGKFSKYQDAQGAVDLLADRGFPVQNLAIVGSDLRQVEHVVGTLSYARVAASGALQGLFYGVVLGFLLMVFSHESPLSAFLTSIPLGVAFWMILAIVGFSRRGGHRSFTAVGQLVAGSYDLVCSPQEAGEARRLLGGSSNRPTLRPTPREQPYFPQDEHGSSQQPGNRPSQPGGQGPWGQPDPQERGNAPQAPQGPAAAEPQPGGQAPGESTDRSQARDFKDLPDGRPRFGIRAENQPPRSADDPETTEGREGPVSPEERPDPPRG
ncbi:general stress protein [Rothia uropygioeca]|uniref:general stress protein n=1 Tax=Kocuria sp. 257 TaxID=2021970 RepID=UPI001011BF9C|nr:general stress protein [Kocuria sp. 257]